MVQVRNRDSSRLSRGAKAMSRSLRDRWLAATLAVLILGLALFAISESSPRTVLQSYVTGKGSFTPVVGKNDTVYFATPHGQSTSVVLTMPQGSSLKYTIYSYIKPSDLTFGYGKTYYQNEVMSGYVTSANGTIDIAPQYVDHNYFINVSLLNGQVANCSVTAYAQFYQVQQFQYPEEIAGIIVATAGIIALAVRMTIILNSRV